MLAVYRRLYDPRARLHLVGLPARRRATGRPSRGLHRRAGLTDAVDHGRARSSRPALEAYFRAADVFVSASDHEGFCVPVVEAMGHGVPVVAYGVAAVPETVGDAGLLLASKEPLRFAAAVHRVVSDPELRAAGCRPPARPGWPTSTWPARRPASSSSWPGAAA